MKMNSIKTNYSTKNRYLTFKLVYTFWEWHNVMSENVFRKPNIYSTYTKNIVRNNTPSLTSFNVDK